LLSGCASTFTSTWKDPEAMPLEFKSQKVVAVVLVKDESTRRLAEDRLAQQIAAHGAQGRSMYSMFPDATIGNEKETRAALEAAGVKGIVVMRPINVDKKIHITNNYQDPSYASFWGGYYGYGFALSYSTASSEPTVRETTVVYVETLVYSLKQNKLVWGGRSKSTNPETLAALIEDLSKATAYELKKQRLITE
jgi:hypothetical protein